MVFNFHGAVKVSRIQPDLATINVAIMKTLFVTLRRGLLLCVAGSLLAGLSACKKKEEAPAAAAAAPAAPATPPVPEPPKEEPTADLSAKWPVGKRFVVHNETLVEVEMVNPLNQQPIKTEDANGQEVAFSVLKARDGGGAEVELEIVSVKKDTKTAGKQTASFDPKSDPKTERNNPNAGMFRKLIGSKLKLQTAADGKIEKVEGLPQLQSRLAAGSAPMVQMMLRGMINEDAIKNWDTLHLGLAEKPVKVGDQWETKREFPFGVTKFTLTTTNTFKGWEERDKKKVAKIEMAGVLAGKEGAPATAISLAPGATVAGVVFCDPSLGVVTEGESTMQFTLNIPQAGGQVGSSKSKTKITSKLTEVTDLAGAAAAATPSAEPKPPTTAPSADKK